MQQTIVAPQYLAANLQHDIVALQYLAVNLREGIVGLQNIKSRYIQGYNICGKARKKEGRKADRE
ncbi:MAG: hypothetical protein LBD28_07480 [Tannerellaceae bacterium]|jgi:hypothetical protein|nr:hypothetical protein [Tannerellaceae bacterium]